MICPYCGGEYADWAHKCPYCDSVNEAVDEQLYLRHLEEIKDRLGAADDEAEGVYQKNVLSSFGRAAKILIICAVCAIVLTAAGFLISGYINSKTEQAALAEKAWEREEFAKLDEWYEAGEYDLIIDEQSTLLTENSEYYIYDWEHYSFVFDYYYYRKYMSENAEIFLSGERSVYLAGDLIYNAASFKLQTEQETLERLREGYDGGGYGISEAELEKINRYEDEMYATLSECFGWSETEAENYLKQCVDPDLEFVSYSRCSSLAEEILGEDSQ